MTAHGIRRLPWVILAATAVIALAAVACTKEVEVPVEKRVIETVIVEKAVPGAKVEGLGNEDAAKRGAIVFLTVPFRAQSETLNNLREALSEGQLLVDCTVPIAAAVGGKAIRTLGVWQGSAAQQAQEMVSDGVTVISALHSVSAPALAEGEELEEDILVCGDKKADTGAAAKTGGSTAKKKTGDAG